MEDFIFGPKPTRHFNMNDSNFDVVDNNDNTRAIIKNSDVGNVKLSRNFL
jgi:hypothetical protein